MSPSFAKTRLVVVACVLLFLADCNRGAKQQSSAVNGVQKLRDAFNQPGCQSIVYQIEEGNDEWRRQWLTACQHMQENLGSWENFELSTVSSSGQKPTTIFVEGRAVFANGNHYETYWMESYWHVSADHTRLYYVDFEGGGKEIELPGPRQRFPGPRDLPSGGQREGFLSKTIPESGVSVKQRG
jgi:hypothetical protein